MHFLDFEQQNNIFTVHTYLYNVLQIQRPTKTP